MGNIAIAKIFLEQFVKKGPDVLKKYAPNILIGVGGIGAGIVISQGDKKKAIEKAYKKGYADAAEIYDKKFRVQTEAFLTKEKSYECNKKEYDNLIIEYEKEIERLKKMLQKTEEELLKILIDKKTELLSLKTVA